MHAIKRVTNKVPGTPPVDPCAPPSLAASINLLLFRWLARDFEAAFELASSCASDTPLSDEESQLWALLADFEDDVEPSAHACRLRLWLALRCCPSLLSICTCAMNSFTLSSCSGRLSCFWSWYSSRKLILLKML